MSDRHKTHNGRDQDGNFRVKQADVEELLEDPRGADFVRDDVRLGGAIADTGPMAGRAGEEIERLIDSNRDEVERAQLAGRGPGAQQEERRSTPRGRKKR